MAAINLYTCETCGFTTTHLYHGPDWERPVCCGNEMAWAEVTGAPHVGALNWTYQADDGTVHTINSFADARRIERESELRARNEEGQVPILFRHLSQDRSNRDVHSLEKDPRAFRPPTLDDVDPTGERRRKISLGEMSADEAERTPLGPGVR